MEKPELVFVVGCNAAGKSTFIRTRLNELEGFEVIMTDVYKNRTKDLVKHAISQKKDIILETVLNDPAFIDLIDLAVKSGYQTSLVVLFLDNLQQSINRVALRGMQQTGITISGSNVKINFNESFKNAAIFYFYFDRSYFIYTGEGEINQLIMSFQKEKLSSYSSNALTYPQKFASYSHQKDRLSDEANAVILANKNFILKPALSKNPENRFKI